MMRIFAVYLPASTGCKWFLLQVEVLPQFLQVEVFETNQKCFEVLPQFLQVEVFETNQKCFEVLPQFAWKYRWVQVAASVNTDTSFPLKVIATPHLHAIIVAIPEISWCAPQRNVAITLKLCRIRWCTF